ncbi:hypothetical protein Bca101_026938 [Brassica carinata]
MKKQKQSVSKEETCIISSTTSMKASGENSGQIPVDITHEILSRLPAKSIARCRVVSKEWGFTLSSQYFTDLFLKMSSLSPCILFTFQAEGKWSFFSSPESMLISDQKLSSVAVDSLSHVPIDYPISVCLPVCGLLCTKDEWVLSGKKDARMMICNPSTGGFKLLPKVKTRRRRVLTYLGYDPVEKVYKVLCMTSREKPVSLQAEQHQVLTLGTGKMNWRMIECSVPHCPLLEDSEICLDGVLYYLAVESGSWETSMSMIVCFDIRSEKFKFIVDEAFKDIKSPSTLINYKGKLGILHPNASGFMEGRATGFVLWVIDDIENHKWCKNIIMLPSPWWRLVAGTRFHIVGTTGDSEIMFSPSVVSIPFYIFCYNMETNSIRRVEIQGFRPTFQYLTFDRASQHREDEEETVIRDWLLGAVPSLTALSVASAARSHRGHMRLTVKGVSQLLIYQNHVVAVILEFWTALPFHVMSAMKKQKQSVSKEETCIISSTTSMKASGENSGQIPVDITHEILSRLPAKSIARCRVVSKEWGFTLSSQYFTDLFLKMSSLSPCILFTFQAEGKWSFFSSPESMLISDQKLSSVAVDSLSHVPIDYPISVCLPVCGLLCTKDEWVLSGKKDARMMICNPSTGGFKLLPKVKTRRRRVLTYLGYDPVEKVYKVLCMTSREKPVSLQAEQHQVLTLGTGK